MKKIADLIGCKEYVREHTELIQVISEDIGDVDWKEEGGNTYVCCSPFRDEEGAAREKPHPRRATPSAPSLATNAHIIDLSAWGYFVRFLDS